MRELRLDTKLVVEKKANYFPDTPITFYYCSLVPMQVGFTILFLVLSFAIWVTIGATFLVECRKLPRNIKYITLSSFFLIFLSLGCGGFSSGGLLVSDSVEYLALARRLLFDHRIDLQIGGSELPSRFQPWFSAFFVAPFLTITSEPRILVAAIAALGAMSIIGAALLVVRHTKSEMHGFSILLVSALGLFLPSLRYFSQSILSDIPATCLVVAVLLLTESQSKAARCKSALLLAVLFLIRPVVGVCAGAADLLQSRGRNWRTSFVAAFSASVMILCVNWFQFDTPLRSGYSFWMPIPYDDFALVFNVGHISANLTEFRNDPGMSVILMALVCSIVFWRKAEESLQSYFLGTSIFSVLLFASHIIYFYPSIRFQIPAQLLSVSTCVAVVTLFPWTAVTRNTTSVLCALTLCGYSIFAGVKINVVDTAGELEGISRCLPNGAYILTDRNPLLVETYTNTGNRFHILPFSREQEYASKVVLEKRPEILPLADLETWKSPARIRALLPQAKEVYPETFRPDSTIFFGLVGQDKLFADLSDGHLHELVRYGFTLERTQCRHLVKVNQQVSVEN